MSDYDIFLSYSHQDRRFVDRLARDLREHHVRVWVDRWEIKVGEQFRARIEDGIARSNFFCFVISDSSLTSYMARKVELEAAFAKMASEGRTDAILPIKRKITKPIPLQLSTYHHLDFSKPKKYMDNLKKLVARATLEEERFTGSKLYKGVDTTLSGTLVGTGEPLRQPTSRGTYIEVFYRDGKPHGMQTYTDGQPDGVKSIYYDTQGRVVEITLARGNTFVDSWLYEYDDKTELRKYKYVCPLGGRPTLRYSYDSSGNKTVETQLDASGKPVMRGGWASCEYVREGGRVVEKLYRDGHGAELRREPAE